VKISIRLTVATLALCLSAPMAAHASGPDSNICTGTSTGLIPLSFTSSTLTCTSNPPNDDNGKYTFAYSPTLVCGLSGSFAVTQTQGPEQQVGPGTGIYASTLPSMTVIFNYVVMDPVDRTSEVHRVTLQIDCLSGATTGFLSD
jgi:hypothetical protein